MTNARLKQLGILYNIYIYIYNFPSTITDTTHSINRNNKLLCLSMSIKTLNKQMQIVSLRLNNRNMMKALNLSKRN